MNDVIQLSDLGEIITGNTPSTSDNANYDSDDIIFVKPSDISNDRISYIENTENYISNYAKEKARVVPSDTVFCTCIGIIGKVGIAIKESAFNQQINAIIPDKDKVTSYYLAYALMAKRNYMQAKANAAVVPIINKTQFAELKIKYVSLEEQRRITDKFQLIDSLIAKREKQIEIIECIVKSRFIEMFGNLSKGSDSENSITLQEMLDRKWITYHLDGNHGGDYPRSHEFIDDGVPYISANCIVNGKIDFSRGKYVSEERANRFRKGIACNKDVLFAHNATVGPVVVLETQYPKVILGTSLTAYRCDCEHIIPEYLKAYMEHPIFIQQYEADMQQTTRNQVPITKQRNYRFIIPKMSYQKEFAAFVELTDKSKLSIQQSIETLQTLKAKLMQDYFR